MSDRDEPTPELDPGLVELAYRMFDWARAGTAEELAAYVDAGVPVNLTDAQGNTLLMLAAYHGRLMAVTALLERGADADRLNDRGQSPLAGAVFHDFADVVQALVDAGADPRAGHPDAVATATYFQREHLLPLLTGTPG